MPGKLEERYRFYLAKKQDILDIMTYIGKYWKPNHILAQNREFFEYEFAAGEDIHFGVRCGAPAVSRMISPF